VKHYEPAKPGTKLAGYNILGEIGRGAASIIYLAQDPKTKQIYALKHVERHSDKDQRFLDQATSEYEIAQKVKSTLIRSIHKLIKGKAGFLKVKEIFLVMEYVDGISIERQPPKTFTKALEIMIQTARAMAELHAVGYVHADMKPNNIVMTVTGDIKIIDLGQACKIGTIKERIQGTPDYIAPEQVHRREITPKTDIYNLGATMYWVLTQHHIPTAIPKGESLVERLDDQFIERPKPANELNPRVPDTLNALIMQCVEVDPNKRPLSMRDVIDRMTQIRGTIQAPDDSTVG